MQVLENRLKSVISMDKNREPKRIIPLLVSDIYAVASNFMVLDYEDIQCNLIESNDKFVFQIQVAPKRIKDFGVLPMDF